MERMLGRYLGTDEVVHHMNHIRNDNRSENLILLDRLDHNKINQFKVGHPYYPHRRIYGE
jgi:hypothetical protein